MADPDKKPRKKAVALRYDQQRANAPEVVASGAGLIAENIIERAREAGIHIEENLELVELLAQVPLGQEIPEELYQTVADILAYVYAVNERFKDRQEAPPSS